jgi:hypothetical protein
MINDSEKDSILSILLKRLDKAKKWTKEQYIKQAERSMKDYDINEVDDEDLSTSVKRHAFDINKRYEMKIPMIFTNTEAMKASLFERLPDLIVGGRGKDDEEKKETVEATYEYLKDRLSLIEFADQAAHWFLLTGFCSANLGFENRGAEQNVLSETGESMIDENGELITEVKYDYNDPTIEVCDPKKTYFSPESKFDYRAEKTTYYIYDKLITPEEIKATYDVEIDADTTLDEDFDENKKDDEQVKEMVKVHFYCGELPYNDSEEFKKWDIEFDPYKIYYIIFTQNKILYATEKQEKLLKLCKWYGHPSEFFGFGLGKIGRQFQIEKTIRRGQQIRMADIAAFPKYTVKTDDDTSIKDLSDPRENSILFYTNTPPGILQPGNLADIVTANSQQADEDAQKAFGILDLTTGSQQSTVETATGQTMFGQAASRRIEFAKLKFMSFYREVVIGLFKLCAEFWDEDKVVSIMGTDGEEKEITLNKQSLQGINFDRDINIDIETLSINKDVVRQQYIVLYDKTKDDPIINRRTLITDMLTRGFEVKNPERYLKDNEIPEGTVLINPQTNEQYTVDKSGELVSPEQTQEMAQPTQGGEMGVPSEQSDVMNTLPDQNIGY